MATYAAKTWTIKSKDTRKLEALKMRWLRAISGVKLRDRVRNEAVRTALHMNTTITDIIKTKRLKWFGHVARRPVDIPPRLPRSKTARPTAQEMVHPNPRGHWPIISDSKTQNVRKGYTRGEKSRRYRGSSMDYAHKSSQSIFYR